MVSQELLMCLKWPLSVYCEVFVCPQSQGLDGFDVWPTISEGKDSPRQEILHNIDPLHKPVVQQGASGSYQKSNRNDEDKQESICEMDYRTTFKHQKTSENIKIPSYQLRKCSHSECVKPARMEEKGDMKAAAPPK